MGTATSVDGDFIDGGDAAGCDNHHYCIDGDRLAQYGASGAGADFTVEGAGFCACRQNPGGKNAETA